MSKIAEQLARFADNPRAASAAELRQLKINSDKKTGEYYPDISPYACERYKPVLVLFGQLRQSSESSERLLLQISEIRQTWMRIQLLRAFRMYVSPSTPVETTKGKSSIKEIIATFGARLSPIHEARAAYNS